MTFKIYKDPDYCIIKGISTPLEKNLQLFDEDFDNYLVKFFDGIAYSPEGVISGESTNNDKSNRLTTGIIANSQGDWICVGSDERQGSDSFIVFGDSFGYGPVFYSTASSGNIVVSNSFQGAVLGLESLGVERTLNVSFYAATIASDQPVFQNSYSYMTMSSEISLLPHEKAIYVSGTRSGFFDREYLGGVSKILSYEDALEKGIDEAKSVFRTIQDLPGLNRRITLTGGVDSRLCLSLLNYSGTMESYRVSTIDSRKWAGKRGQPSINRDVVISNRLREKFDLGWWPVPARTKVSMSFLESISAFQSYRSNFGFTFSVSSIHTRYREPVISVRGGGGEVLRIESSIDRAAKDFEQALQQGSVRAEEAGSWYAERLMIGSVLRGELRAEVIQHFDTDYPLLDGISFRENIFRAYLSHRYRAHFGHQRHTTATNDLIYHPLSSTYFLRAAKLIPFDELCKGQMVSDIFNRTSSSLLQETFANDSWSSKLTGKTGSSDEFESDSWTKSYDEQVIDLGTSFEKDLHPGDRSEAFLFDSKSVAKEYISYAFEEILTTVPDKHRDEVKQLHRAVFGLVQRGAFDAGRLIAKLASALDCFYLRASTGRRVEMYCDSEHIPNYFLETIPQVDVNPLAVPNDGRVNLSFPLAHVKAELVKNSLFVAAEIVGGLRSGFEVAFYLYKDGVTIDSKWYSSSSSTKFELLYGPGNYQVEVFLRRTGSKVLLAKLRSEVQPVL